MKLVTYRTDSWPYAATLRVEELRDRYVRGKQWWTLFRVTTDGMTIEMPDSRILAVDELRE